MNENTRVVLTDLGMSLPFAGLLLPWLLTHGRDELDPRSLLDWLRRSDGPSSD